MNYNKLFILIALFLLQYGSAFALDTRISDMSDGGVFQAGDIIPAVRSGANYKITLGDAAAGDIGSDVQAYDSNL